MDKLSLAKDLAIRLTPDSELPSIYRKSFKNKTNDEKAKLIQKQRTDTYDYILLDEFTNDNIRLISLLQNHLGEETTVRIVSVQPKIEEGLKSVAHCKDFLLLTDFFDKYRDENKLDYNGIGILSMLLGQLQKHIEKIISSESDGLDQKRKNFQLKDKKAQLILELGQTIIDGVEINLWQGHSFFNIQLQESWNKIKSFTELNNQSTGVNGHIVFSGAMQISRNQAAEYAQRLGFKIHSDVSKNTDYFVVGSMNVSPLDTKRVIDIKKQGGKVKVVSENDFLEMVIQLLDI